MADQNQLKPQSTKQVRIRVTCGATIEVTENDSVIEQHHQIVPMANFDRKGFQEAFDFIELARQAKQIELDEEFEQQQQEELARQAARSFTDKVFGFLFFGK